MGRGGRGRGRASGWPGRACPAPPGRSSARSPRCATSSGRAATTASSSAAWAGRRWPPRWSAPRPASRSSCSTPPTPTSCGPPSPTWTAPWSSCPASPAPRSRPTASDAPSSRPSATPGSTPPTRMVVVTDPGSPLDEQARGQGFRVVNADPEVGGRYSALTAFGLVPSGLAGADVEALLDDAEAVADLLAADDDANPALRLGAALAGTEPLRDKLVLVDAGTENVGFPAWAEQLIAESTGKEGTGLLPVVAIGDEPAHTYDDGTVVRLVATDDDDDAAATGERLPGHRGRAARGAVPPLGGRHRRRRRASRHQPLRPARRRERQGRPPATCWRPGIGAGDEPAFTDGAVEVRAAGGDWLGERRHARRRRRGPPRRARPRPRLRRGHGLPGPRGRRRPRARRPRPVRPHRSPGDLRVGPPVPPLHRPVPQGRSAHGPLRAGHGRSRRGPRGAGPRLHLRPVHRGPGRRRRHGARRPRPAGPAPAPHRPRRRARRGPGRARRGAAA